MEPTQSKHPVFEANQVLTNAHLNQNFDFLDEQERLTRANLIGTGVLNGLDIAVKNGVVEISKGCGITSEGYLITLPENLKLVSYAAYTPPINPSYRQFENQTLWELLESEANGSTLIDDTFLEGKTVLLFLELNTKSLRNCSPGNCDNKGSEITFSLKPLLAGSETIKKIISGTEPENDICAPSDSGSTLIEKIELPTLVMPRFDVPSTNPTTPTGVLKAFQNAISSTRLVSRIGLALRKAYNAFKPLIEDEIPESDFEALTSKYSFLESALQSPTQALYLQYFYDFCNDLIEAYNELLIKSNDLISVCCPPPNTFPRHLMLGSRDSGDSHASMRFRHLFIPALAATPLHNRKLEIILLMRRIAEMIRSFIIPAGTASAISSDAESLGKAEIRITPDRSNAELLSERSIPWYYRMKSDSPLYRLWNPGKTMREKAHENLGYRSDEYPEETPEFVVTPLAFNLEPYPFFRVEGHIGKPYQNVIQALTRIRSAYRLAFDIVVLHAGKNNATPGENERHANIEDFLDSHPGITHRSGVSVNGTFVLVCQSGSNRINALTKNSDPVFKEMLETVPDSVIADFYLPYRIEKPEILSNLLVRECSLNWIDSVRHLNNLSLRQYRPVATDKAPASTEKENNRLKNNYIVRIYHYDIQGISLLPSSKPVDIEVPLAGADSVAKYRLSAIAAEINKTFPLGLVFDSEHETNSIVLRSLEGHRFRIELGGLQGNMIRYAYTENGMYRHVNNEWEPMEGEAKNRKSCRHISGSYREEAYEWLHRNFEPSRLTAVPAVSAEEVIVWEKTTLKRARTLNTAASLPIYRTVLEPLAAEIRRIDPSAKIMLVGSWANGSWVSKINSENPEYPARNMSWNSFLELRKKVTGKTGCSGIELMIESAQEITENMIGISAGYPLRVIKGKKDAQKGLAL